MKGTFGSRNAHLSKTISNQRYGKKKIKNLSSFREGLNGFLICILLIAFTYRGPPIGTYRRLFHISYAFFEQDFAIKDI